MRPLPGIYIKANEAHVKKCEAMLARMPGLKGFLRHLALEGTILYPGNPGGVNWGSMAFNPIEEIAVVAVNRLPTVVKLLPRKTFRRLRQNGSMNGVEAQFTAQSGVPYGMARFDLFNDQSGFHCLEGPWSTLVAFDLSSGKTLWEVPAGVRPGLSQDHPGAAWGYFVNSGPVVTGGG